jgi:hypothetical protein
LPAVPNNQATKASAIINASGALAGKPTSQSTFEELASTMTEKQTPRIGEGKPGPGRPKGVPNKTTQLLKDAILQAAADAGDGDMVAYLAKQAKENPGPFLALIGKVLPMQVTGEGGGALVVSWLPAE